MPYDRKWFGIAGSLTRDMLLAARELTKLRDGETVIKQGAGGFGDLADDSELAADRFLGEFLRRAVKKRHYGAGRVTVEGLCDDEGLGGTAWYAVDPLDGSLDFATRGRTLGLPYAACVTAFDGLGNVRFGGVGAAAVMDLRPNVWDEWVAWLGDERGGYRTQVNGRNARVADASALDLTRQIVLGEMYYPDNRQRLARAFAGEKGWLRSCGSAAYEMALVASGTAVAFVCGSQKQHELGAGYALVKGAGGVAVDWDGRDLGVRTYDFKTQTPVVLACNMAIADQILERLHRE